LRAWASSGDFLALRTRAFVLLCWSSGLRVSEALALDNGQILEQPIGRSVTIRSTAYLRAGQSTATSSGAFAIPKTARAALREYMLEGVRLGVLELASGPLFVAIKGRRAQRISVRSAQHAWTELQARAGLEQHYRTDDLRYDAIVRFSAAARGDVGRVQAFGRFHDVRTAARYVRTSPMSLAELSGIAARA